MTSLPGNAGQWLALAQGAIGMLEQAPGATQLMRVLLIEDNLGFAYFIRDVLLRLYPAQFELREAGNLQEGLRLFESGPTDVILLDLGLPDSARMNTFANTRAKAPHTPIIVLTVLDDDDLAMQAMRTGAQDYLVKSKLDSQLLVRSIRYAKERSQTDSAVRELSARLMNLQDAERRRIARDLHDSTAQTLAALLMNLSLLNRWVPQLPPEAGALLQESASFAHRCSDELRTTAYLLHPPLLDELGLAGAVRQYCDGFAERSGIRVDLELPQAMDPLAKDTKTALFRVMQECLANIHRHSGSKTASIRFSTEPSILRLEVRDEGRGLVSGSSPGCEDESRPGVGIAGMRERIRQLQGRFDIVSGDTGTTVVVQVPNVVDQA